MSRLGVRCWSVTAEEFPSLFGQNLSVHRPTTNAAIVRTFEVVPPRLGDIDLDQLCDAFLEMFVDVEREHLNAVRAIDRCQAKDKECPRLDVDLVGLEYVTACGDVN